MKMKKTVALFLTICCIGSFVACSDNSDPTKQSTEPDATRPNTTEADTKEVPDETEEVPASVELNVDFRTMSVDEIADECIRAITNYPKVGSSVNDYLASMPNPADPSWIRTDYIGFPGVACGARYFNDAPENFAFYPKGVTENAKKVKPSSRGELEITSLNNIYLNEKKLKAQILGRGFAWLDTGTMDSLVDATMFVQITEKRQGVKISAPEEIAFRKGWINKEQLMEAARLYGNSPYGEHLKKVANGAIKY